MKKRFVCICLVISIVASMMTACTSDGSSSSKSWENNANSAGYEKKNGKWYYTGDGAY